MLSAFTCCKQTSVYKAPMSYCTILSMLFDKKTQMLLKKNFNALKGASTTLPPARIQFKKLFQERLTLRSQNQSGRREGDPDEHVQVVYEQLNYFGTDDASKCKLFALTLVGPTRLWFNDIPDGCIDSCTQLCKRFST